MVFTPGLPRWCWETHSMLVQTSHSSCDVLASFTERSLTFQEHKNLSREIPSVHPELRGPSLKLYTSSQLINILLFNRITSTFCKKKSCLLFLLIAGTAWAQASSRLSSLSLPRWHRSIRPRSAFPSDYHWQEVWTCWERHFPSWYSIWHWDGQQTILFHREHSPP